MTTSKIVVRSTKKLKKSLLASKFLRKTTKTEVMHSILLKNIGIMQIPNNIDCQSYLCITGF